MGTVTKIHPDIPDPIPGFIKHRDLDELARNPDLIHYQIVCHWKGSKSATGWSQGIALSTLAIGNLVMQDAVTKLTNNTT